MEAKEYFESQEYRLLTLLLKGSDEKFISKSEAIGLLQDFAILEYDRGFNNGCKAGLNTPQTR